MQCAWCSSRANSFKRFQQDLKERVGALGLGATAEASVEPTNGENPTLTAVRRALMIEYQLERLGWRVSGLNCGGATPMPRVQRWLKSVYEGRDCSVTENYASTEAGPITNSWGELEGVVSAGVVIKLLDWGEYKSSDKPFPRGELLVKSAAMSTGYLNRPDLTASTFDEDGYVFQPLSASEHSTGLGVFSDVAWSELVFWR